MQFFLDDNFPRTALTALESAGHTAVHTLQHFPPGTADDVLFAEAQRRNAIFVSTDAIFSTPFRWPLSIMPEPL